MHAYKQKETNCAIETRVVRGTKVVSGLKCVYAGGKEVSEKRRSKGRKTLVEETCCYCVQAGQYTFTCHAADKGPHWKRHTTDLIKITHWVTLSTSLLSLQWFLKARLSVCPCCFRMLHWGLNPAVSVKLHYVRRMASTRLTAFCSLFSVARTGALCRVHRGLFAVGCFWSKCTVVRPDSRAAVPTSASPRHTLQSILILAVTVHNMYCPTQSCV